MKVRRLALVVLLVAFSVEPARGADYVWIVGGGPTLGESQAQIELNVKWEREVIRRRSANARLQILYTDGKDPRSDVVVWRHPPESSAALQPLARVFGVERQNGERYHSNTVPDVAGGTRADELENRLRSDFSRLRPGDRLLFVFYGHGTYDPADVAGNALRLWGDTRLTARQLETLLSAVDVSVPVRFILPQCFSGGFSRIIHPGARDTRALTGHNRCGFMSVAENREAEGCTPSINVGDYRDYSSYLFAALDGRTRQGQRLSVQVDRDGDGRVSLREAHFYSLVYGDSTDLPRSTSETYLEQWEPWYLRWLTQDPPDNVYARLAAELASRHALPVSGAALIREMKRRQTALRAELSAITKERAVLKTRVRGLQDVIRAELAAQWPDAMVPYTRGYYRFLLEDLAPAQDFIMRHPRYAELVRQQERDLELETSTLAAERALAQLERILWLRRLARILNRFERLASREDRAAYQRLVSCEESGL